MIEQEIKSRIEELTRTLEDINHFLETSPEGCLKIQLQKEKPYFYQQIFDKRAHQFRRTYISKKNSELTEALAMKGYYLKVKPIIEKQLIILKRFIAEYSSKEITYEYNRLSEIRKTLVNPIQRSSELILEQWNNEIYQQNDEYPENLRFETNNGEMVRSKSELIIANALAREEEYLLYKYERPLKMDTYGGEQIFHLDFTVLNLHTGKIKYWEHAGKMDDPEYTNRFVWKMNTYQANGIIPGKDLLVTYETKENPLSIQNVRNSIEYLKEI